MNFDFSLEGLNLNITEDGVEFDVKGININDFVIDKVFKRIDKKNSKKKHKEIKKSSDKDIQNINDLDHNCYVIEIN